MKAVARQLHREGKATFFFRLEHLVSGFELAFDETGTLDEFNHWLDSEEHAWFFLDSVDESKLHKQGDFEIAIKRFVLKLGDQKQRAHIFITSRISEWQPQSDLSFIKRTIPFIPAIQFKEAENEESANTLSQSFTNRALPANIREPKPVDPEIFTLCPLDQEQRRIFSQVYGISDVDAFLTAIERAEADIFSGRPQDLIELIDYWKRYHKIANRAKLIENSVTSKLREIDLNRASQLPLNLEKARYGAETLAAAVTFLRRNSILIPEQKPDPLIKTEVIDIQSILSWEMKPIRALLQKSIFDNEMYGCVRFHHRSFREYLTAQWVHHLLLNKKSRREIEALFFKSIYGQPVLIPSMRPILSWLILLDDRIREKAIDIAPEICLEGGDPSALPIDLRRRLLEKFCVQYAKQSRWGFSFDISELKRFSDPGLAETINGLLKTYRDHEAIRQLLLRMIWQGEIHVCAETALEFALNGSNDSYTRKCGIRAIGVAGSGEQKEKLVHTILADSQTKGRDFIGELISVLAPDDLCPEDILILIQRVERPDEYSHDNLMSNLKEYSLQKCPKNQILTWCNGLLSLLKQSPIFERRHFEVSQKYMWLLQFAALAVERLVLAQDPNALEPSVIEIISLTQNAVHHHDYYLKEHQLAKLVPEWPELNHALFWFDVNKERARMLQDNKGSLTDFWNAWTGDHYWHFAECDFEKIMPDITHKPEMDDRLVALSLAFQLYKEGGRGRTRRMVLKKAVRGLPELERRLHVLLNPPAMSTEIKRHRRSMANFEQKRKRQKLKSEADRQKKQEWVQTNISSLRDTSIAVTGGIWNTTRYLLYKLQKTRDLPSHWESLIPEFGQDVAEAYRDGCIDYWRKYRPELLSENAEDPYGIPYAFTIGLSGLEMEAQLFQGWPNNLSEEEVKLACRYVCRELNKFPFWLPKLYNVFPHIVEMMLMKEIAWEFSQYDGEEQCHYVLSKVTYGVDWLKPKLAKQILPLLRDYEPKHNSSLTDALGIVLAHQGLDQAVFVGIAKTKIENISNHSRQALWLAVWMCVDANGAIKKLKTVLNNLSDTEEATQFSMLFIIALLGERHVTFQHAYQDFNCPGPLFSLIQLMHTHIRASEDIDRGGTGAFRPVLRDHAQNARNRLFNLLNKIPGEEAYLAILNLSKHANKQVDKKWYALSAKQRAEADAEDGPWQAEGIAQFAKDAEHAPQNHRELFKLLISRLLDLKAELEGSNTSISEILQTVQGETKHRNFIADWLNKQSKGRYSVPQEDELADGTRPDIHIYGVGIGGPVPIELKVVDNNWSGSKLFERLKNQLCGQYLRDLHSNCGIYLLVYRGPKKNWVHPKTGKYLQFDMLVESLKVEAQNIISKDKKIESLEIIGIDLSKRKCSK